MTWSSLLKVDGNEVIKMMIMMMVMMMMMVIIIIMKIIMMMVVVVVLMENTYDIMIQYDNLWGIC